ncbi:MAG: site-specific DNA-methyltransferase, partial [Candidatus Cloacimonetes bacterium]|nr:site-specific DNA-methyltransferase [Candidatus Cloacimonadota bacterium]
WKPSDLSVKTYSENTDYPIKTPSGRIVSPPSGYCWRLSKDRLEEYIKDNRIWFGKKGNNVPRIKRFLSEVQDGSVSKTIWYRDEVGDNQEAKKEVKVINSNDVFTTPKPERLIERILTLATKPGDLVLDSFLGSGTTAAVAHKMGRRWIGIELGQHCHTHCIPRLKQVIDGTDEGGITKAVKWTGGGGFRYYYLAPSLLIKDAWGNLVINSAYNQEMLAEAVCKNQNFKYAPDETIYWKHGYSTENDYIFVTTQTLEIKQVRSLSEDVGKESHLIVMCKAFLCNDDEFANITLKKIPDELMFMCEWSKDDYSLQIKNLPGNPNPVDVQDDLFGEDM